MPNSIWHSHATATVKFHGAHPRNSCGTTLPPGPYHCFETEVKRLRDLKGSAQAINLGADLFLADATGRYLKRICDDERAGKAPAEAHALGPVKIVAHRWRSK